MSTLWLWTENKFQDCANPLCLWWIKKRLHPCGWDHISLSGALSTTVSVDWSLRSKGCVGLRTLINPANTCINMAIVINSTVILIQSHSWLLFKPLRFKNEAAVTHITEVVKWFGLQWFWSWWGPKQEFTSCFVFLLRLCSKAADDNISMLCF